jgi:spermidine/putrescine transport system ATP-binding protein
MIAGFIEPDSGDIAIGGKSMRGVAPNRRPSTWCSSSSRCFR